MIQDIFKDKSTGEIIDSLKKKTVIVPEWEKLKAEYDSTEHEVMTDKVGRKDRKGVKAARITYGMQKLRK